MEGGLVVPWLCLILTALVLYFLPMLMLSNLCQLPRAVRAESRCCGFCRCLAFFQNLYFFIPCKRVDL